MLAEERRRSILSLLERNGSVRTVDLARQFAVSDQTIRRDFWALEDQGLLSKAHGGALLLTYQGIPYQERAVLRQAEKLRVAQAAARLVKDGMSVALGPGTTTEAIAQHLRSRDILLVTNSLAVAAAMSRSSARVRLTGGQIRPGSELVTGDWAEANLAECFVDLSFVGVSGIDLGEGASVTEADEARVLRQFIRIAKRAVLVADGSKFGRVAKATVAPLGALHLLITDPSAPAETLERLRAQGLEVEVAGTDPPPRRSAKPR
mgnify:CR=1 FL=1